MSPYQLRNTDNTTDKVQVEMSGTTLASLLDSGLLHCGDCICLNASAKEILWQSLLMSSTTPNALDGWS